MKIADLPHADPTVYNEDQLRQVRASDGTLEVPPDRPASAVAKEVDKATRHVDHIVLADETQVYGVISTHALKQHVAHATNTTVASFADAVGKLVSDSTPREVELLWCDKGAHYTDRLPCPEHL
jgi:hypothetical protein